jgi:hypothetical protein
MEDEDLLQTLQQVEAMASEEINLDDISSLEEEMKLSVGQEEEDESSSDSEFFNEYESTFNFIDSELDALRSSIDEIQPSFSEEDKKDMDDASYSSSSDRSPFQMPVIDESVLDMGMEESSEPESEEESEGEEEMEAQMIQATQEFQMEQEMERPVDLSSELEAAEQDEPQVDTSAQIESVQSAVEKLEQDTIKHPLQETFASQVEIKPQEDEARPDTPRAPPPTRLDEPNNNKKKKPSQTWNFLAALFSIALAFLTGQRFPKQYNHDQYQTRSLEMAGMQPLLQPHEFQPLEFQTTIDLHHKNLVEETDFEQILFESDYCESQGEIAPLFDIESHIDSLVELEVQAQEENAVPVFDVEAHIDHLVDLEIASQQEQYAEAIESLSNGEKAAHAAAIHEALEAHELLESSKDFDFGAIEFFFEDVYDTEVLSLFQPMLEEIYFQDFVGEISAADWATPKLLEMMQDQNMETVHVVQPEEEASFANQCVNLRFDVTEYDGLFISMEMMQTVEPHCAMPILL